MPQHVCSQQLHSAQTAYRHQTAELKSVTAALNSRDEQLSDVQRKLKDVSHAQAADKQTLIDVIASLKGGAKSAISSCSASEAISPHS